jgi:hypothetical protein
MTNASGCLPQPDAIVIVEWRSRSKSLSRQRDEHALALEHSKRIPGGVPVVWLLWSLFVELWWKEIAELQSDSSNHIGRATAGEAFDEGSAISCLTNRKTGASILVSRAARNPALRC